MKAFLLQLHNVVDIGFVGGASYAKHQDQLGVDRFRAFRCIIRSHIPNGVFVFPEWDQCVQAQHAVSPDRRFWLEGVRTRT